MLLAGNVAPQSGMALSVTSSSRRLVMAALLALAVAGGVIRHFAADPSIWRDVGTLLLVLWLPAVGNLIAYFVRKINRSAPPPAQFAAGSAFTPHLHATIAAVPLAPGWLATLDPAEVRCTMLTGRQGFTMRASRPLAQLLEHEGAQELAFEALLPAVALKHLVPGTDFHLLAGTTAVAKGRLVAAGA